MDLKEIQALIKFVAKSGAQEVSLETEDFKINIKTGSDAEQPTIIQAMAPQAPVAMAAARTSSSCTGDEAPADDNSNYITVKSPMIGTFTEAQTQKQMLL